MVELVELKNISGENQYNDSIGEVLKDCIVNVEKEKAEELQSVYSNLFKIVYKEKVEDILPSQDIPIEVKSVETVEPVVPVEPVIITEKTEIAETGEITEEIEKPIKRAYTKKSKDL